MENNILEFPITVFGNIEKYNETLTKARCRIFYKGANRNGSFITDEFADKLIQTLPYAPIKGIYDEVEGDYTDHGKDRNLGRIYGVVPENNNFAWEEHTDSDGIIRNYACVDVLLYSAIYKEANEIINKAQSMELYAPSIKGEWEIINGQKYYKFTEGCFLGLQILGEDVEPCFEGAAFFQLMDRMEQLLQKLDSYQLSTEKGIEGGKQMFEIDFKLSDNQKFNLLWDALNPEFNEEGGWVMEYEIMEVYDDYALAYACGKKKHFRVYYTKDDTNDEIILGEMQECFIIDVTESEKNTLDSLRNLNNGNYEKLDEVFETYKAIEEKVSDFELKIAEQVEQISTLNTENINLKEENEKLTSNYSLLQEDYNSLKEYKANKENKEKFSIIDKYALDLDDEILNEFREKIADFNMVDLEKELAFKLVQSKPTIFSTQEQINYVPVDDEPTTGIESILEKYRK